MSWYVIEWWWTYVYIYISIYYTPYYNSYHTCDTCDVFIYFLTTTENETQSDWSFFTDVPLGMVASGDGYFYDMYEPLEHITNHVYI